MAAVISVLDTLRGFGEVPLSYYGDAAEAIPELSQHPEEMIAKHRYYGFCATVLEQKLRELGRDKLAVCGVAADCG